MKSIIIGAGLSGLGAKSVLPKAKVYEGSKSPGGHAQSHLKDGFFWDEGAHICHSKNEDYLCILDKKNSILTEKSMVNNIYYGDRIGYPVQNNIKDLTTDRKTKAIKDLINRPSFEAKNYEDWLRVNYGNYLTDTFYKLFTEKYWNCSMAELSTDWLSGRVLTADIDKIVDGIFEKSESSQAVFSSFTYTKDGGYFGFFKDIYNDDPSIKYNYEVKKICLDNKVITFKNEQEIKYDNVLSSIPLKDLSSIIPSMPDDLKKECSKLVATQAVYVNLLLNTQAFSEHWLYIYDHDVLFSRVYSQTNLEKKKNVTIFQVQLECYFNQDQVLDLEEITKNAIKDFLRIFNLSDSNILKSSHLYKKYSYVVSTVGTTERVNKIITWLESRNYYPIGLYGRWKYVWSDQAWLSGRDTAKRLLK